MSSMLSTVAAVTVATVASSDVASLVGKYRIKGYNGECLTDVLGFTACDSVDAQTWTFAGDNDEVTSLSQLTCIDAGVGGGEWGDVTLTNCTNIFSGQQWTATGLNQLSSNVGGCMFESSRASKQLDSQYGGCCMEAYDSTVKLWSCDGYERQIWTFDPVGALCLFKSN